VNEHLAWYVSRGTGIVAWGLIIASMVWGFLYASRVLARRARPWWMLGVHRFLGALAVVFVIVHVLAIVADNYTSFGLVDVLVPFASSWKPIPVALGIVGMYILVTVEVTSLLQRHLPRTVWRQIHLASYGLFGFATLHALSAGTDTAAVVGDGAAVAIGAIAFALAIVGLDRRSGTDPRRPVPAAPGPLGTPDPGRPQSA